MAGIYFIFPENRPRPNLKVLSSKQILALICNLVGNLVALILS